LSIILALVRLALGVAAVGLCATSILAVFGFALPLFDLFNHLQVLIIAASLAVLVAVLIFFIGSGWQGPLAIVMLVGLGCSALVVAPESLAGFAARPPLPAAGRTVLTLMTHNVFGQNYDMQRLAQVIAAENPDIIALQEYFGEQRGPLAPLIAGAYPYSAYCVGGKRANIALYAKLPFVQGDDGACSTEAGNSARTAHILATFTLADGTRFSVVTTHFDWPLPLDRQAQQRDAIIAVVKAATGPLILVGDFNSTPWSYAQRQFAADAGLTRQTRGVLTWPARFPIFGWRDTWPILPLDQVMTRGVDVHSLEAGPATGSDHLPVIIRFSVPTPAGG
jgi:endonuclease/exonuclease/phosphatase (EEP) superfamily protein YafD